MINKRYSHHQPCRRKLTPIVLSLVFALTAGCSSDDDDVTPSSDDPSVAPGELDTINPVVPVESDETAMTENSMAADTSNATDPDGDDRPGLVVAGLGGLPAEEVTSQWLANTYIFRNASPMPTNGEVQVDLLEYPNDFPVSEHVAFFSNELDTCNFPRDATSVDEGNQENDNPPPPSISGGTSVTINSPSGPWVVLEQLNNEDITRTYYERAFGDLPNALPEGATLSIPGDLFPNVAAYPLSEPDAPARLLPNRGDPLDADTVYIWVPGNGSDYIDLSFIAFDSESGDFIDFAVICSVIDDGSFEMPDDVSAFIDSSTDRLELRYERVREIVELSNGIVFRTATIVAE